MLAESKEQCGAKHQPGQHVQKSLRGRLDQKERPRQSAENTGQDQRNHHPPGNAQLLRISAAARGSAHPESKGIGGVGGDRRNTRKQKSGKGNETPTARNGVDSTSDCAGEKQENGCMRVQTKVLS